MQELVEKVKQIASHLDGWVICTNPNNYFITIVKNSAKINILEVEDTLKFIAIFPGSAYTYTTCPKHFKSFINIPKHKESKKIAESLQKQLINKYLIALNQQGKKHGLKTI